MSYTSISTFIMLEASYDCSEMLVWTVNKVTVLIDLHRLTTRIDFILKFLNNFVIF
jgi:hypothetical protein